MLIGADPQQPFIALIDSFNFVRSQAVLRGIAQRNFLQQFFTFIGLLACINHFLFLRQILITMENGDSL